MKKTLVACALAATFTLPLPAAEPNTITCKYEENIPYGVAAWSQSERVRKGIGKEARFAPYVKGTAVELANDALVERGGEADEKSDPRETAFWQAYDDKGWYLYIESKEPLVKDLLNRIIDPLSPGRKEAYEVFFAPGKKDVPYYQIFITPYTDKTVFYDWGVSSADYRSLKEDARVESLPLANGVGTFVFIPWHLLYERVPLDGDEWRFTVIRWMPFGKAGGVTWGGRVHETGKFGLVEFEKPTKAQREAIERRLLQYAWYKFQATSGQIRTYVGWNDEFVGDPEFHEKVLVPEIARLKTLGEKWGDPEKWTAQQIAEGMVHLKDFMEFDYKVSALRAKYLEDKLFSRK